MLLCFFQVLAYFLSFLFLLLHLRFPPWVLQSQEGRGGVRDEMGSQKDLLLPPWKVAPSKHMHCVRTHYTADVSGSLLHYQKTKVAVLSVK